MTDQEAFEQMVKTISKAAKLAEEKVRMLIEEKQEELSSLVSAEGAAYIVGRELGVNLLAEGRKNLKIKNLRPGMGSVDITARVLGLTDKREFERSGKKGAVRNITLGDQTGTVRLSVWNEELDLIEKLGIKRGDVLKLSRGLVREDNRQQPELRIGRGSLEKVEDETDLPEADAIRPAQFGAGKGTLLYPRKQIADLKEGDLAELRACIVQVFQRNPFYSVCPNCQKRVTEEEGKWSCQEHGQVEKANALILTGVLDDGSGAIRSVFFRELAEKVYGKSTAELLEKASKEMDYTTVYGDFQGYVRDFLVRGRIKKNALSGNLELVASAVEEMDPVRETEGIVQGLEAKAA